MTGSHFDKHRATAAIYVTASCVATLHVEGTDKINVIPNKLWQCVSMTTVYIQSIPPAGLSTLHLHLQKLSHDL